MVRIVIGSVLGAVVYFAWGMAAWMFLPLHMATIAGLPDEDVVTQALKDQNLKTGVYAVPWSDNEEDWGDRESAWWKKHQSGPLYSIYYESGGENPMEPRLMAQGFAIDLLATLLAACLLWGAAGGCCNSYLRRVGFVLGLGIFVALIGHASYWNWMHFPTDYTVAFIIDVVAGWMLTGFVLAAIVRPAPPTPAAAGEAVASANA